jgi:hypothetical protein
MNENNGVLIEEYFIFLAFKRQFDFNLQLHLFTNFHNIC